MKELYKKHRPKTLKDIIGQDGPVKVLQVFIDKKKVPHSVLITGPSGCGKTTIARILRKKVRCGKHDFRELDCADFRGIDMVRSIRKDLMKAPISGKTKVWLIDECHKMTVDAQNAFLKMLEDTPKHVYFILCTTDPQKLKKTIRTRCTEIAVKSLTNAATKRLVNKICKIESIKLPKNVLDKIVESSEGSARKALVLLNQVFLLEDDDMLAAIENLTLEDTAIFLGRLLMNDRTKWPAMAKALKDNKDAEPESIRWGVLGYARSCLISGSKISDRAYIVIESFRDNFFDSKHAGLAAACYEVIVNED